MLLEAPNPLVALGGLIGPVGPIEAVESNGISTELYGRIPIQPVLRVLSVLSATAVIAAVAGDLHSRFGSICGPCRTSRILWEDRISCINEVSFKIKDTLLPSSSCSRGRSGSPTTWS